MSLLFKRLLEIIKMKIYKFILLLTFSLNSFANEVDNPICADQLRQDALIQQMAESADEWDFKSNVCEELTFHQVAESYRSISIAYENISMACANSKPHVKSSIEDLRTAKKDLDQIFLPVEAGEEEGLCSSFDFLLTTIDAMEDI
jgi:hypothetical protein